MSSGEPNPFVHVAIMILMLVMGIQDLRTRRVSNWLTIPFFFVGLIINLLRAFDNVLLFQFVLLCQAMVFLAGYHGWMGGADMKVFVGLLGMVPAAGMASLIASGVWGTLVWVWTGNRNATFPAVLVSAFAAVFFMLTMIIFKPSFL